MTFVEGSMENDAIGNSLRDRAIRQRVAGLLAGTLALFEQGRQRKICRHFLLLLNGL
jgi:hypothetical protein